MRMKSLRSKMVLHFCLAAFALVAAISVVTSFELGKGIAVQAKVFFDQMKAEADRSLETHLGMMTDLLLENLRNRIDNTVKTVSSNAYIISKLEERDIKPLRARLEPFISASKLDFAIVFGPDGEILTSFPDNSGAMIPEFKLQAWEIGSKLQNANAGVEASFSAHPPLFIEAMNLKGSHSSHHGAIALAGAEPIVDDFGEILGAIIVGKLLNNLGDRLEELSSTTNSSFLIYADQWPIAQGGLENNLASEDGIEPMVLSREAVDEVGANGVQRQSLVLNGQVYFLASKAITTLNGNKIGLFSSAMPRARIEAAQKFVMGTAVSTKTTIQNWLFAVGGGSILVFILASLFISSRITGPISLAQRFMDCMADGDLSQSLDFSSQDEIGRMTMGINKMSSALSEIVGKIGTVTKTLSGNAANLLSKSDDLVAGAKLQTSQMEQAAAAMSELSCSIQSVATSSNEAATAADRATSFSEEGKLMVDMAMSGMEKISHTVADSASALLELGKSSERITAILDVIDDIAEQTNLLALNAAIEAARAGEHGRGFSVVADEVRKLAEKTGKATKEIAEMIARIQEDAKSSVQRMEAGKDEVDSGVRIVNEVRGAMGGIVDACEQSMHMAEQIASAAEEQAATTEEVSTNFESIAEVAKEAEKSSGAIKDAAQELTSLANELRGAVDWFKLG